MRGFLIWMTVGAFLGSVVATFIAPYVLETLLATTGAQDAMCQCSQLVANTASLLIKTQIWGAVIGAAILPIVVYVVRRMWGRRFPGDPTSAPASP
jgi:hypothetical protein